MEHTEQHHIEPQTNIQNQQPEPHIEVPFGALEENVVQKPHIDVSKDGIGAVLSLGNENETLINKITREFSHIEISDKAEFEKTLERINAVANNIRNNDYKAALKASGYNTLKIFIETEKHLMTTTVAAIGKEINDISHIRDAIIKARDGITIETEALSDYINSEREDHSNDKLITSHLEKILESKAKGEKTAADVEAKLVELENYKKTHIMAGINILFSVENMIKTQKAPEAVKAWSGTTERTKQDHHHHDKTGKISPYRINSALDRVNVSALYAVAGSWKDCSDTGPFFYKLIVIVSMLVAVSIGVYVIPHYFVVGIILALAYASPMFILLVVSAMQKKVTDATNNEIRMLTNVESKIPPLEIEPNSRLFHATKNLIGRKTTYTREQFSEIADIFGVLENYGLITSLARHGLPLTKNGHDVFISTPRKANLYFIDNGEAQHIFNYIRSSESPTIIAESVLLPILINMGVINVHEDKAIGAKILSLGNRYDWYQKNLIGMAYRRFNSRREKY